MDTPVSVQMDSHAEILISTEKSRLWAIRNYSPDVYSVLVDLPYHHEPEIVVHGLVRHQRRDIIFLSDVSEGYTYSRRLMPSTPFSVCPDLLTLMEDVNKSMGTDFNGLLINRYTDGSKYLSAHSDAETFLDKKNKMVAAISYGPGVRKFRIRDKKSKKIVLDVEHDSLMLLVMEGEFQSEFTHKIPPTKKKVGERISITFRHHTK